MCRKAPTGRRREVAPHLANKVSVPSLALISRTGTTGCLARSRMWSRPRSLNSR
jgi:hypothetical protein